MNKRRFALMGGAVLVVGRSFLLQALASGGPSNLAIPVSATVTTLAGVPLEGTHDLKVTLFADPSPQGVFLHEETFLNHPIVNGELTLVLGHGQSDAPLTASIVSAYPRAVASIMMDGEVFAPRLQLGSVPVTKLAYGLDMGSLSYGGSHGVIPVRAIEAPVTVVSGFYTPGDAVENFPEGAGWTCTHRATVLEPGRTELTNWTEPALEVTAGPNCRGRVAYIASVGPLDPGLNAFPATITVPSPIDRDPFDPAKPLPEGADRIVYAVAAKKDCGFAGTWVTTNLDDTAQIQVISSCSRFNAAGP